jgi:tetratricopeptide (TPR) repeat protein
VLKPIDALQMMKRIVGIERIKSEPWVARRILKWLGYLPLAIELVSRYLDQDEDILLEILFKRLQQKRLKHHSLTEAESTMYYKLGVSDAFEISWDCLDEATRIFACILSLYAPVPFFLDSLEEQIHIFNENRDTLYQELKFQGYSPESISNLIVPLLEQSLEESENSKRRLVRLNILNSTNKKIYKFHPLIREFLRDKLDLLDENNLFKTYFANFLSSMAQMLLKRGRLDSISDMERDSLLVPHFEEVFKTNLIVFLENENFAFLFQFVSSFYERKGLYSLSYETHLKLREEVIKRYGKDSKISMAVEYNLGRILRVMGQYKNAQKKIENVFAYFQSLCGERDAQTLTVKNELALTVCLNGDFARANEMLNSVLKSGGDGTISANVILEATLFLSKVKGFQGDYLESYKLLQQSRELSGFIDSSDDIDSHNMYDEILNDLGVMAWRQGDYKRAEQYMREALEIAVKRYARDHPCWATGLCNLGSLYNAQGKYKKAEENFLSALEILKRCYGLHHPDVASASNNLGLVYSDMRNFEKAEYFLKQAYDIRKKILRVNHPDYASSLNNLGLLYAETAVFQRARELLTESLKVHEKNYGKFHQDYLVALNNMGLLNAHEGNSQEAERIYKIVIKERRKVLHPFHPDLASSMHNLADLYAALGKWKKAEALWEKALKIALHSLGPDHPDTTLYSEALTCLPILRQLGKGEISKAQRNFSENNQEYHSIVSDVSRVIRKRQ